jgi:hypothetical protein
VVHPGLAVALNFTPWLLSNAARLGEAIGVELELTRAEHPVGKYSLDLIGRDMTNGAVVIVENQLPGRAPRAPAPGVTRSGPRLCRRAWLPGAHDGWTEPKTTGA